MTTKLGFVYVSDLLQSQSCVCHLVGVTEHLHKNVDKLKPHMCLVTKYEGKTRVNNLNINNEIDNDIHKHLP